MKMPDMRFPDLSLLDRTTINRILLIVVGSIIPLVGFLNIIFRPELKDPLYLRIAFGCLCYGLLILSYSSAYVKKELMSFAYFLYVLLILWVQYGLYNNSLHPAYAFIAYVVFIGISISIYNLYHLRIYLVFFCITTALTVSLIENPVIPAYIFAVQLFILGFLIYLLINSYLHVQRKLEISNENFLTLFNNADEVYFLVDKNFILLKINQQGRDFLNLKYAFALKEGDRIFDFFNTKDLKFLVENFEKALKGETVLLEQRISFPKGVKKWFEIKFLPVVSNHQVSYILISGLDVTDKKHNVDNLRASEARFRAISDSSPLGVYMNDAFGNNIYSNHTYHLITGLTAEETREQGWKKRIFAEDINGIQELWKNTLDVLGFFKSQHRYVRPDGGVVWTVSQAAPIKDGDAFLGYVGTLEDITEFKYASDALKISEKQFRDLFELAPIGMVMTSLEGEVLKINNAIGDTLGYNEQEILKMNFSELIFSEDFQSKEELSIEFLREHNDYYQHEKRFKHKNGEVVFVILTVSLLNDPEGNPAYILAQILDITSRKNAESLLEQKNAQLRKINSELDAFVYSAAHDLRAPLSSILGVVSLIKLGATDEELNDYLLLVEGSVRRLDTFINDIIDYSRNSRTDIKIEEIKVKELIQQSFDSLKFAEEAKSIKRIIDLNTNFTIHTDKRRLEVILNNLISNAFRYHDHAKEDKFVSVKIELDAFKLLAIVEDNGLGIEEQYLEKIFDMFYRASESSKGSGLGLYIVKEAVNKLKGKIWVESEPGVGTRFYVEIPDMKL